jgi:hypothetical protein
MVQITSAHGDTDLSLPTEDPRIYTNNMDDDWKLFPANSHGNVKSI